ncbi:MAG: tetratricopeptide repeat protein [Planctomycetota bacterium]|nr:tetratricopeptide repeat protein [Planctomycetota bacterium]
MPTLIERATDLVISAQYAQAEKLLRPYLARHRDDAAGSYLLGHCLARSGRLVEAIHHLERAASVPGAPPNARVEHATAVFDSGRHTEGVDLMAGIARDHADHTPAHVLLAKMLLRAGLFVDAMESCLRALQQQPDAPDTTSLYASCLAGLGRAKQAVEWYRKASALATGDPDVRARLCFSLNSTPADPRAVYQEHLAYGRLVVAHAERLPAPNVDRTPGRRLRVGFLSPDFREHPVARFIAPVLRGLDRAQFEVVAYDVGHEPDGVTASLRTLADVWRDCATRPDAEVSRLVRADAVDILIDLAGITGNARPGVLAARPAPVQIAYLGYPNTTGLPTIDFRIVDGVTDPAGAPLFSSERLLRIDPCFLCFDPPDAPLPAAGAPGRTHVVFGSFNNATKLSDATLDLWRDVLAQVPGSRLALKGKGLADAKCRRAFERRFAERGLDVSRIDVLPYERSHAAHLRAYDAVDIALDTFPYAGTTTTCEALWMGVPVVTLAGNTHASRVSASILRACGLGEWVASDAPGYARLAGDLARARPSRQSVRAAAAGSALCDVPGFVARFGAILHEAWRLNAAPRGFTGQAIAGLAAPMRPESAVA